MAEKEKKLSDYIIDFSTIPYERKLEERALYPFSTLNYLTGAMELGEISIISGETGCVDCDTEYFNGTEWKRIADYDQGEKVLQWHTDGTADLAEPIEYIKKPCDWFYSFRTKNGLSQTLSPEHRIIYLDKANEQKTITMQELYDIHTSNKYGFTGKFMTTFNYNGSGIGLDENIIRLMVAVVADGSFHTKNNTSWCRINLKRQDKKERIEQLLNNAKIKFDRKSWNSKDKGYTNYVFYSPIRFKTFPKEWYNCSQKELQIIYDELKYWDAYIGSSVNGKTQISISTTDKQNADFMQFVCASTGHRASIFTQDRRGQPYKTSGKTYYRKSIEYEVFISQDNITAMSIATKINKIDSIDSFKYCFCMPSDALVFRKDNRIFVSRNSGKSTFISQCVSEIIKHDKVFCVFGESTIEKQVHAQYRQMTPYNDNDYKLIHYYKDNKKTNVAKYFVGEKSEQKIKEQTAKKLFYYDPNGGMDIQTILSAMQLAYEKSGIKYFIIDNIMQLSMTTNNEVKEMKDNFEELRRFVIDKKIHCAVLAHYRKNNDYNEYRRRLEEIAGTSAIGNKCATAINIIRLDSIDLESKYSKSFAKLLEKNGYNLEECDAVIEVLKTRHNKLGFVGLKYNHKTNTYYECKKINNNQEETERSNVVAKPMTMEDLVSVDDIDLNNIF